MSILSKQFILLKRPEGVPDESICKLQTVSIPNKLEVNELHLHGLYFSVDPYMRGRMNDSKSYVKPFALNQPLEGNAIARVIDSKSSSFSIGDLVIGQLPWATEMVVPSSQVRKIDLKHPKPTDFLGALGMTGLTAYFGLLNIGQPKAGETVVVSAAAGAVGSIVGQIAKIKGCKVVGIVGSLEKEKVLKEQISFDETLNYKSDKDLSSQISRACPNGVDIYFDNVGGTISDAVIKNMNFKGRIVLCGQISLYNSETIPQGPRIQPSILIKSILMQGFIVSNYTDQFQDGISQLSQWLTEGKIKPLETIVEGFENLPKAFISLFTGMNVGKMIVKA